MDKKGIEITPTSACDVRWIEVEYLYDKVKKNKTTLVDNSLVVYVGSLEGEFIPPTFILCLRYSYYCYSFSLSIDSRSCVLDGYWVTLHILQMIKPLGLKHMFPPL